MADKTNANIGFEKQLWDAACVLWGHIPAAEYRKVIIGLIFLRYISAALIRDIRSLLRRVTDSRMTVMLIRWRTCFRAGRSKDGAQLLQQLILRKWNGYRYGYESH